MRRGCRPTFALLLAKRHEIAVAIYDAVQLPEQGGGFVIGQVKVHDPEMGSLTKGCEIALGTAKMRAAFILIATHGGRTCRNESSSGSLRMRSMNKRAATPTP